MESKKIDNDKGDPVQRRKAKRETKMGFGEPLELGLVQSEMFESETLFRNLVENLTGVYWVNDLNNHQTLYISSAYEKIWGRPCEDLYKNPGAFITAVHPDDLETVYKAYRNITTLRKLDIQYRIVQPNGNIRWIMAKTKISADKQGRLLEYGYAEDITEQKLAEKQYRQMVHTLSEAQKISKTGSFVFNLENHDLIWSEEHYRIFEMSETPANQLWEKCRTKVHPDDLKGLDYAVETAVRENRGISFEHRILCTYGKVKYLNGTAETFIGDDGKTRMLRGTVQDVTERKETERLLAAREQHLRAILDAEPECVKLTDITGRLLDINLAGVTMLEADNANQLLGHNISDIVNTPYREVYSNMIKSVLKGKHATLEFEATTMKGKSLCLETNVVPMRNNNGEITTILSVTRNITDRKLAEEKLRLSQQQLLEAQRIARIGNFEYDFKTGIWHCSEMLDEISGLTPDSIMHFDKWINLIAPDHKEEVLNKINPLIERGEQISEHYVDCKIIRASDGAKRWVSIVGQLDYDNDGHPIFLKGTVQDVTERKLIEHEVKLLNESLEEKVQDRTAQLVQVNKELEAFNYTVSHDLQNPLRSLNGFSKLLLKDYADKLDSDGREYLQNIEASARRMSLLIKDLLHFAQIGKVAVAKTKVDMNRIVQSAVQEVNSAHAETSFEIVVQDLKPDFCDPALIRVVWDNLIGNAVKYSSRVPTPKIEVGVRYTDGSTVYYVKDNGAGFEMKDADKLFKVFERLHKSSEFEGTGIGLATVERIVMRHGGQIWAEGNPGEGAVFYFSLPSVN